MSSPLRVLAIGHSYAVARNRAAERVVASRPGFEVTVAAPRFFHGYKDLRPVTCDPEPAGSPLRVVALGAACTRIVHLFRYEQGSLRRLLAAGRFDLVYAWEEPYIYAGYQIAREARRGTARFSFRTAQSLSKRYPPPLAQFERSVLRSADAWVSSARMVQETMLSRGYPADRARLIPLAVDLNLFYPLTPAERNAGVRELGLRAPVIGFVGRLVAEKGLDVLMQAIDMLDPDLPWTLLVLGSGPYHKRIQRWAAARRWPERVRQELVRHEDMPRYLGLMDVLIAPSQTTTKWKEQFGRMIIEAFAAGVPVVSSDSGELPFVVGEAGRVVHEKDPAAYAAAIGELLRDPARRQELVCRGLDRARQYSTAAVADTWQEFYLWLAAQPRRETSSPHA